MTTVHTPALDRPLLDSIARRIRSGQLSTPAPVAAPDEHRADLPSQPTVANRSNFSQQRLDNAVLDTAAFLVPLQVLPLPVMSEGVDEPPGTPDTEGDIFTQQLSPGGVDYYADLLQRPDKTGLPDRRWWLHTWVDTASFPAAPEAGRLFFKFSVEIDFLCLTPGAQTRGVFAFTTLQSTNYLDIRWPLQISQFTALQQTARVDLTGSIPATVGQQLDLHLTYGMLLVAGNGEFESQGSFATHRTVPEPTPADYGLIEYRFIPDWWITSVNRLSGLLTDYA